MAAQRSDWLRDRLRELGVEDHEAEAARIAGLDMLERAAAERRELEEKLTDLIRRVEKLEQSKLEPGK